MKQAVLLNQQTQMTSSSSIKDHLIKYCYANTYSMQESVRELIRNSEDYIALSTFDRLLEVYVMPYYYVNRTVFNRIRNSFIEFVHLYLTHSHYSWLSPYAFLACYKKICIDAKALEHDDTLEIVNQLIQKCQSEITRLT